MAQANYEKFCEEVFKLHSKIRYVGIFEGPFTLIKMRPGLENLLTVDETKISLADTLTRWKTRQGLAKKLGKPLYAMAEYEKVKRITVPIGDDGLILVSAEPSIFHEVITKEIIELRDRFLTEEDE